MVHELAGTAALVVARMTVFGVWMTIVASTPIHLLAEWPRGLMTSPGIFRLLPEAFWDEFLDPTVLWFFRLGLGTVLLLVVLGARPRRALAVAAALGVLLFDATLKSFGTFISHSRMVMLYSALLFSLTPSVHVASVSRVLTSGHDRDRLGDGPLPLAGALLRCGALILAVPYFLIGIHRFISGGVQIFLADALPTYMVIRTVDGGGYPFEVSYTLVGSSVVLIGLKAGFFLTTVAEVLSPLAVFNRAVRLMWLPIIVGFHVLSLVTMRIFFWENLILILLFFTEFPTWVGERLHVAYVRLTSRKTAGLHGTGLEPLSGIIVDGQVDGCGQARV